MKRIPVFFKSKLYFVKQFINITLIVIIFNVCHAQNTKLSDGTNQFPDSINLKAKKLKQLYLLSTSSSAGVKEEYHQQFFDAFPNSFNEFNEIYGYVNNKPAILYFEADKHIIELFNKLRNINDTLYFKKLISIAIGGHWDADAVNYFQNGLKNRVINNPELTIYVLKNRSKKDIKSFWYFFFDGAHPKTQIPEHLKNIKSLDLEIYNIMIETQKQVLKQLE